MGIVYISELLRMLRPELYKKLLDKYHNHAIRILDDRIHNGKYTKDDTLILWNAHTDIQYRSFKEHNGAYLQIFENGYTENTYYLDAGGPISWYHHMHYLNNPDRYSKDFTNSDLNRWNDYNIILSQSKGFNKQGIGYNSYPMGFDSFLSSQIKGEIIFVIHPNSNKYLKSYTDEFVNDPIIELYPTGLSSELIARIVSKAQEISDSKDMINVHIHSSLAGWKLWQAVPVKLLKKFNFIFWTSDGKYTVYDGIDAYADDSIVPYMRNKFITNEQIS